LVVAIAVQRLDRGVLFFSIFVCDAKFFENNNEIPISSKINKLKPFKHVSKKRKEEVELVGLL